MSPLLPNVRADEYGTEDQERWCERRMPKALKDALRNGPLQRLASRWYEVYRQKGLEETLEDLALTNSKLSYETYGAEHPNSELWAEELERRKAHVPTE